MAGARFLKGTEEWQLFMDFWGLCQKYWEPENSDEYWYGLAGAAQEFQKKYGTEFALALARALMDEMERKLHAKDGG